MSRIGYARSAAPGEDQAPNVDILIAAGCERVFVDHTSGALADRPELATAVARVGKGDQLVVCQLDHPARSLGHLVPELTERHVGFVSLAEGVDTASPGHRLVFAALAELERSLGAERVRPGSEGAKAAKARGA